VYVQQSWLSPDASVASAGAKGVGVFATRPIPAGTTVAGFGGSVIERAEFDSLEEAWRTHALQIDDRLYMVSVPPFAPADHVNHSCEPNCGIIGTSLLVALRDIDPGEEICFDYAMTDTDDYDEFECSCGTPTCRHVVSGADWKEPDLRDRYRGWCSTYIERLIS
jgi:hypothetical protein